MALADYIFEKPVIETERLTIRALKASDVPALFEWIPDKSLYNYWGKGPGKTYFKRKSESLKAMMKFCFEKTELRRI